MSVIDPCLCGNAEPFDKCCGKYLDKGAYPLNAEALMRSRYSAYVTGNAPYLIKTWHPDTCPELTAAELEQTKWLRLQVVTHKPGLKKSIVEFRAYFEQDGQEACLHEVSLFKKLKNRWVYVEAENF